MDSYPLCSTAHCRIVLMMHNMTSDCKMLTRLANKGQNGGKTGGGSAANKVNGCFCRTRWNTVSLLDSFDILHSKNVHLSILMPYFTFSRKVRCIRTATYARSKVPPVPLFPGTILRSEIKSLTQRSLSIDCCCISMLSIPLSRRLFTWKAYYSSFHSTKDNHYT